MVSIDDGSNYYLDINHDGLVDKRLNIGYYQDIPHRPIFTKYIQAGDTLKYRTLDTSALYLDSCHSQYNTVLDSVNNRSSKDLRYIYEINALRTAAGQPKQR